MEHPLLICRKLAMQSSASRSTEQPLAEATAPYTVAMDTGASSVSRKSR